MEANLELTVVRYEVYPRDEPTSLCVGFSVTHKANGKTMYKDCLLPLGEFESSQSRSEDALEAAWATLRPVVEEWYAGVKDKPLVIGSVFVPAAAAAPEPEAEPEGFVDPEDVVDSEAAKLP